MTPKPALVRPDGPVHRVARGSDIWAWPDWHYATADGTFGNRWDDPNGEFRVLYASSTAFGALLETLAPFRPDLEQLATLEEIDDDHLHVEAGTVPSSWLEQRWIGEAELTGSYVDVGTADTLAWLRPRLASRATELGIEDVDAATIRLGAPRTFTQAISRLIYEYPLPDGGRPSGLRYRSRYDDNTINWAVFEPARDAAAALLPGTASRLQSNNPDIARAFATFGLQPG